MNNKKMKIARRRFINSYENKNKKLNDIFKYDNSDTELYINNTKDKIDIEEYKKIKNKNKKIQKEEYDKEMNKKNNEFNELKNFYSNKIDESNNNYTEVINQFNQFNEEEMNSMININKQFKDISDQVKSNNNDIKKLETENNSIYDEFILIKDKFKLLDKNKINGTKGNEGKNNNKEKKGCCQAIKKIKNFFRQYGLGIQ